MAGPYKMREAQKEGDVKPKRQPGETGRDWRHTSLSRGRRQPPEAKRGKEQFSLGTPGRSQPCTHLDLSLLASSTGKDEFLFL